MAEIKRGDKVTINDRDDYEFRVMAVADGYAMLRFPHAVPFVERLNRLHRSSSAHQIEETSSE